MKDLFGKWHQDPPPMDAPLPFVVWEIYERKRCTTDLDYHTEPEYWLARTDTEAREAFAAGLSREVASIREVPVSEHSRIKLVDESEFGERIRTTLQRQIAEFEPVIGPCCIWAEDME